MRYKVISLLVIPLLLLTGCAGTTNIYYDSRVDPENEVSIDKLALIGVGDDDLIEMYEAIFPDLVSAFEEGGKEEVRTFYVASGDEQASALVGIQMSMFAPDAVMFVRPYFSYSGGVRVNAIDIQMIARGGDMVWRSYLDIHMTGADQLEDSYEVVRNDILQMLIKDDLLKN